MLLGQGRFCLFLSVVSVLISVGWMGGPFSLAQSSHVMLGWRFVCLLYYFLGGWSACFPCPGFTRGKSTPGVGCGSRSPLGFSIFSYLLCHPKCDDTTVVLC